MFDDQKKELKRFISIEEILMDESMIFVGYSMGMKDLYDGKLLLIPSVEPYLSMNSWISGLAHSGMKYVRHAKRDSWGAESILGNVIQYKNCQFGKYDVVGFDVQEVYPGQDSGLH